MGGDGGADGIGPGGVAARRIPAWVASVDAPAWVCDLEGRILHISDDAAALFGRTPATCLGEPCYRIAGAVDAHGQPCCKPGCRVLQQAGRGAPIPPERFWVRSDSHELLAIKVISITDAQSSPPVLVHVALPDETATRADGFIVRLAGRTTDSRQPEQARQALASLTRRERQVLDRLVRDQTLQSIAAELGISYHTVRTHLKKIFWKLGVHSTMEAVARYLTYRDD